MYYDESKRFEIYQKLSQESKGEFDKLPIKKQKEIIEIKYLADILTRIFLSVKKEKD